MLKVLKKRIKKNSSKTIEIDFVIKNELIYYIKNKRQKLCISINCEKIVFKLIYDANNHAKHHRIYQKLLNAVYMSQILRKI